jgi:hypothetical protein
MYWDVPGCRVVKTAGLDLSSQEKKSAICVIEWSRGQARIEELTLGFSDARFRELADSVDKLGIDVPLGWPMDFASAVSRHSEEGTWPTTYRHSEMESFRYRRTDIYVRRTTGLNPLSVSTDRLGIPAMRAAALLSSLGRRIKLDGSGVIAEVYPAAALTRWGFQSRQYKGKPHQASRRLLVASFAGAIHDFLPLSGNHLAQCEASDDVFDALIAALVTRAASIGAIDSIPADERSASLREGWIALPREGSLGLLPAAPSP